MEEALFRLEEEFFALFQAERGSTCVKLNSLESLEVYYEIDAVVIFPTAVFIQTVCSAI